MAFSLITTAELLHAPTGFDWGALAENTGATSADEAIEQSNIIKRASWSCGHYCGQPLGLHATLQTETARVSRTGYMFNRALVQQDGYLEFYSNTIPILQVSDSRYTKITPGPQQWQSIDPSQWIIFGSWPQIGRLVNTLMDWSFLRQWPGMVQVSYLSGFPNAILTASAASGATLLQVDDIAGFNIALGQIVSPAVGYLPPVTIQDAALTEQVQVASVSRGSYLTTQITSGSTITSLAVASTAGMTTAGVQVTIGTAPNSQTLTVGSGSTSTSLVISGSPTAAFTYPVNTLVVPVLPVASGTMLTQQVQANFPITSLNVVSTTGLTVPGTQVMLGSQTLTVAAGSTLNVLQIAGSPLALTTYPVNTPVTPVAATLPLSPSTFTGSGVLTLVAGILNAHGVNVGVSAVPDDVKQAVIFACTYLARERGTDTLAMGGVGSTSGGGVKDDIGIDAEDLLSPYKRWT